MEKLEMNENLLTCPSLQLIGPELYKTQKKINEIIDFLESVAKKAEAETQAAPQG